MNAVDKVRRHIKAGRVYRRKDLKQWSNAVDRHLSLLQKDNTLEKLSGGLYYCPRNSTFGLLPPSKEIMIKAFLKSSRFLITSFNYYNCLGVGTTQLYNETMIYNYKRHGVFKLGNRTYKFVRKRYFPMKLSKEFLMVDLVDNVNRLAEDQPRLLEFIKRQALKLNRRHLLDFAQKMGSIRTQKFFVNLLKPNTIKHEKIISA